MRAFHCWFPGSATRQQSSQSRRGLAPEPPRSVVSDCSTPPQYAAFAGGAEQYRFYWFSSGGSPEADHPMGQIGVLRKVLANHKNIGFFQSNQKSLITEEHGKYLPVRHESGENDQKMWMTLPPQCSHQFCPPKGRESLSSLCTTSARYATTARVPFETSTLATSTATNAKLNQWKQAGLSWPLSYTNGTGDSAVLEIYPPSRSNAS
jgi:hypothetical protein